MTNKNAGANEAVITTIVGGAGKTGRRVAERLARRGLPARVVSRSGELVFDWNDDRTWKSALDGTGALYLTYYPDLAVPGAADQVRALCDLAVGLGIDKIVLLAGRGEPQVRPAEDAVRESGARFTILECAFFNQNFDEGLATPVDGKIYFPAGDVGEPFIDCDDIAACAVEALTDPEHDGKTYELTGPRLLTFAEATAEMAEASGRPLSYVHLSFEQYRGLLTEHLPGPLVDFFIDLFRVLLDGHNAHTSDGVEQMLGRPATDFAAYARDAAEAWR